LSSSPPPHPRPRSSAASGPPAAGGDGQLAPVEAEEQLGRRVVPFWILQLAELLAAVALADLSLHVDRGGLLVAGTGVFALLAITAKGPLGLVRVVPRRLHVYAVCVVAVVLALAPILPQIRPDVSGIIIIEFAAIGLFRLATLTNTVVTVRPPRGSARAVPQGGASTRARAPGAGAGAPSAKAAASAENPHPSTGAEASARSGTDRVSTTETAGRWISRQASAAAQHASIAAEAAALTADKHGPAARAQAGRAVRSAGRLTGRLTRSVGSGSAPGSSGSAPGSSGSAPGSSGSGRASTGPVPGSSGASPGPSGSSGSDPSGADGLTETGDSQGPEEPT
jgi:hypothetical protein